MLFYLYLYVYIILNFYFTWNTYMHVQNVMKYSARKYIAKSARPGGLYRLEIHSDWKALYVEIKNTNINS